MLFFSLCLQSKSMLLKPCAPCIISPDVMVDPAGYCRYYSLLGCKKHQFFICFFAVVSVFLSQKSEGPFLAQDPWTPWSHFLILTLFRGFACTSTCVLRVCVCVCVEGKKRGMCSIPRATRDDCSTITCITVVNRHYLKLNELNEYSAVALMWFERQVYVPTVCGRWHRDGESARSSAAALSTCFCHPGLPCSILQPKHPQTKH